MKFASRFVTLPRACGVLAVGIAMGFGSTAQAASADADATATVVRPITITKTADLQFGSFSTSASGQTVTISSGGTRSNVGTLLVTSTVGAASFTVGGEGGLAYTVTLPSSTTITRSGGSETMTVNGFTSNPSGSAGALSGTGGSSGSQTLTVGATLTTGASQVAGNYTGSFTVSVEYN